MINAVNLLRGASVYPINKAIFLDANIVAAEAVFPEVTNGSDVPDANQQTAVSPSTSCQSLIFTALIRRSEYRFLHVVILTRNFQ